MAYESFAGPIAGIRSSDWKSRAPVPILHASRRTAPCLDCVRTHEVRRGRRTCHCTLPPLLRGRGSAPRYATPARGRLASSPRLLLQRRLPRRWRSPDRWRRLQRRWRRGSVCWPASSGGAGGRSRPASSATSPCRWTWPISNSGCSASPGARPRSDPLRPRGRSFRGHHHAAPALAGPAHARPDLLPGSVDAATRHDPPPRVRPASGAFPFGEPAARSAGQRYRIPRIHERNRERRHGHAPARARMRAASASRLPYRRLRADRRVVAPGVRA